MTTHEILCKAKAYLLTHGWQQDSLGGDGGPACLRGALIEGAGGPTEQRKHFEAYARANVAVEKSIPLVLSIPRWNDAPERTFDEVIAAIDKAILATAPKDAAPLSESLSAEEYIDALSPLAFIPAEALHA